MTNSSKTNTSCACTLHNRLQNSSLDFWKFPVENGPEFSEKEDLLREVCRKSLTIYYLEFPFRAILHQEFLVDGLAFRKFNNFWDFPYNFLRNFRIVSPGFESSEAFD